jgi:hypothetical protein
MRYKLHRGKGQARLLPRCVSYLTPEKFFLEAVTLTLILRKKVKNG